MLHLVGTPCLAQALMQQLVLERLELRLLEQLWLLG